MADPGPSSAPTSSAPTSGYLDDIPNFTNRSLDLFTQLQYRSWKRSQAQAQGRRQHRRGGQGGGKSFASGIEARGGARRRRGRGSGRAGSEDDTDADADADADEVDSELEGSTISSLSITTDDEESTAYSVSDSEFYDSEAEREEAEQQWREAVDQLTLAVRVMMCPLLGKWLGRKWAYWAFSRYKVHNGLGLRFFGLSWVPETVLPDWMAIFALPAKA